MGAIIALLFGTVQISRSSGGGFAGQVRERRRKSERDKGREKEGERERDSERENVTEQEKMRE